ncbi:Troponin I-like 2 [Homarus americanus]|uniref:Troponin I-like 2 n=1 Tax=Homarus americanus TaxID=6706 RepID=A0A8J5KG35_HOMAM|nr:Troponin I-like 2 [Homarus americanus]
MNQLRAIVKEYYEHIAKIESGKYDVEMEIIRKDYELVTRFAQRRPYSFYPELEKLCRDFHIRIASLEGDKWDLEHQIKMKDYQVTARCPQATSLASARWLPAGWPLGCRWPPAAALVVALGLIPRVLPQPVSSNSLEQNSLTAERGVVGHTRAEWAMRDTVTTLSFSVAQIKKIVINELNIQVNDLRGKFIKPTLKKVSKYENKFAKLQKKAAEFNFRNQLKTVKKKEFELEDDKGATKPDWAAGGPGSAKKVKNKGAKALPSRTPHTHNTLTILSLHYTPYQHTLQRLTQNRLPEGEEGEAPTEGDGPAAEEGGESAPTEGAPTEDAPPAEAAPAEGTPSEEAPAEAAAEAAPAEGGDAPPTAEEAPAEAPAETPAEPPAEEVPSEATPAEGEAPPPAEGEAPPAEEGKVTLHTPL